jgi:hypothetical protein
LLREQPLSKIAWSSIAEEEERGRRKEDAEENTTETVVMKRNTVYMVCEFVGRFANNHI